MNVNDTIRGWKSKKYRFSLSAVQLKAMLTNPAGMQELDLAKLEEVSGGHVIGVPTFEVCHTLEACRV